jgi:hypothetical protein
MSMSSNIKNQSRNLYDEMDNCLAAITRIIDECMDTINECRVAINNTFPTVLSRAEARKDAPPTEN